jgi:hypothetical protein
VRASDPGPLAARAANCPEAPSFGDGTGCKLGRPPFRSLEPSILHPAPATRTAPTEAQVRMPQRDPVPLRCRPPIRRRRTGVIVGSSGHFLKDIAYGVGSLPVAADASFTHTSAERLNSWSVLVGRNPGRRVLQGMAQSGHHVREGVESGDLRRSGVSFGCRDCRSPDGVAGKRCWIQRVLLTEVHT